MKNYRNFLYGYLLADLFLSLQRFLSHTFTKGFGMFGMPGALLPVVLLLLGLVMLIAVDKGYAYRMRLWALLLVYIGVIFCDALLPIISSSEVSAIGRYSLFGAIANLVIIIGFALATYRQNQKKAELKDYTLGVWAYLIVWRLQSVFSFATRTLDTFAVMPTPASHAITWASYLIVAIPAALIFVKSADRVSPWMLITYLCITLALFIARWGIVYYAKNIDLPVGELVKWVPVIDGLAAVAAGLCVILYYNALRVKQNKVALADKQISET